MSSTGVLVVSGPGRGISYPRVSSLFVAGVAVTANQVYALDETQSITSPNGDSGVLARVRAVEANDLDVEIRLVTFVMATETQATVGKTFRGVVEQWGVTAQKTSGGVAGESGTATVTTGVIGLTPALNNPILSYNLDDQDPGPVHFNGTPGGFCASGGAT